MRWGQFWKWNQWRLCAAKLGVWSQRWWWLAWWWGVFRAPALCIEWEENWDGLPVLTSLNGLAMNLFTSTIGLVLSLSLSLSVSFLHNHRLLTINQVCALRTERKLENWISLTIIMIYDSFFFFLFLTLPANLSYF